MCGARLRLDAPVAEGAAALRLRREPPARPARAPRPRSMGHPSLIRSAAGSSSQPRQAAQRERRIPAASAGSIPVAQSSVLPIPAPPSRMRARGNRSTPATKSARRATCSSRPIKSLRGANILRASCARPESHVRTERGHRHSKSSMWNRLASQARGPASMESSTWVLSRAGSTAGSPRIDGRLHPLTNRSTLTAPVAS